jgi:prepilin-type N-terminal cleavage/methylation domain-containing protein
MSSRARRQDGFTLPEVLIACVVGLIIVIGALTLLESTLRLSHGVMDRTDAMQRGRLALDDITRSLRSQMCLGKTKAAVISGDGGSVTYYASYKESGPPEKRTLVLDPVKGTISELRYAPVVAAGGAVSYAAAPTLTRQVLTDAQTADGATPFLRYFTYRQVGATWTPDAPLAAPLDATTAARVARIDVAFLARPSRVRDAERGTVLRDSISVRHADPNANPPAPTCV